MKGFASKCHHRLIHFPHDKGIFLKTAVTFYKLEQPLHPLPRDPIWTPFGYLRLVQCLGGILCKIWVRVGHGSSPIWLKFCMQSCCGVLTTKWMFQSSGKFYFGSFDHGLFRSAPKGSQNSESKVFLSFFCPAYHNLLTKTINTTLKGHLSTHILCRILLWNKKIWSWTSEKL